MNKHLSQGGFFSSIVLKVPVVVQEEAGIKLSS